MCQGQDTIQSCWDSCQPSLPDPQERYASFDRGIGAEIEENKVTLEELEVSRNVLLVVVTAHHQRHTPAGIHPQAWLSKAVLRPAGDV